MQCRRLNRGTGGNKKRQKRSAKQTMIHKGGGGGKGINPCRFGLEHHHRIAKSSSRSNIENINRKSNTRHKGKQPIFFLFLFFLFLFLRRVRGWACRCVAQRGRYLMLTTDPGRALDIKIAPIAPIAQEGRMGAMGKQIPSMRQPPPHFLTDL